MEIRVKALITAVIGLLAAVAILALTVYPFDYGIVESTALAVSFILAAWYKAVLDDTFSSP